MLVNLCWLHKYDSTFRIFWLLQMRWGANFVGNMRRFWCEPGWIGLGTFGSQSDDQGLLRGVACFCAEVLDARFVFISQIIET